MAKRKRAMTEEKIAKWIKEGRGTGQGYRPWRTIHDAASTDDSCVGKGSVTGLEVQNGETQACDD